MKPNIPNYTSFDLEKSFTQLSLMTHRSVNGIDVIDSGQPGPTLGITINTHGNEPSGLACYDYLKNHYTLSKNLLVGKVIFVLNNIQATRKYFDSLLEPDAKLREILKLASREVDLNMNRLPSDVMENLEIVKYEALRARELSRIWSTFNVAIDIHSTTQDSPMIVSCGKIEWNLIKGFPISTIISNITNIQINKPAVHFYGDSEETVVLGIESGSHENEASFTRAITCCEVLLFNLGMVKDTSTATQLSNYNHYKVTASVLFTDESYELTEIFGTFSPIQKGKVIATSSTNESIVAPISGHTLFCGNRLKPLSINEEVMFLSEPVETISGQ